MRKLSAVCLLFLLLSCSRDRSPVRPQPPTFSFPLAVGNQWTYSNTMVWDSGGIVVDSGSGETVYRIPDTILIDGLRCYRYCICMDSIPERIVGLDGDSDYVEYIGPIQGVYHTQLKMPFHPAAGFSWVDSVASANQQGEVVGMMPFLSRTLLNRVTVLGPDGTVFEDCWQVRAVYAGGVPKRNFTGGPVCSDTIFEYYKSGVGLVKAESRGLCSDGYLITTTRILKAYALY